MEIVKIQKIRFTWISKFPQNITIEWNMPHFSLHVFPFELINSENKYYWLK